MLVIRSTEMPKDRAKMAGYLQAIEDLAEYAKLCENMGYDERAFQLRMGCETLWQNYKKAHKEANRDSQ